MAHLCVTTAHRRAAFEAFAWAGLNFEQALADPVRARLIEARATQLARREHDRHHAPERVLVRRRVPGTDRWITTTHPGPCTVPTLIEQDQQP